VKEREYDFSVKLLLRRGCTEDIAQGHPKERVGQKIGNGDQASSTTYRCRRTANERQGRREISIGNALEGTTNTLQWKKRMGKKVVEKKRAMGRQLKAKVVTE